MKRKALFMGLGVFVLTALFLALGNRTATSVLADPSSVSWDMYMDDPVPASNPANCTLNDNDNVVDTGECVDVASNFWQRPEGGKEATQGLFDLANTYWTVGPMAFNGVSTAVTVNSLTDNLQNWQPLNRWAGCVVTSQGNAMPIGTSTATVLNGSANWNPNTPAAGAPYVITCELTGDGINDPTAGLAANRPATLGAKVGTITFKINSGLLVGLGLNGNVDDTQGGPSLDPQVTGQTPACNRDINGDTTIDTKVMGPTSVELWNAIVDSSNGTVAITDTDASGKIDTQDPDAGGPGAPAKAPKAVRLLPAAIPSIETALGLPVGSAISRGYGIAIIEIIPGTFYDNSDVNFLVYNVSAGGVNQMLNLTLLNYPGQGSTASDAPGFNMLSDVKTCPPFWTAPANILGVTAPADYDGNTTPDLNPPVEPNRRIVGTGGPWDYRMMKSSPDDWEGDNIAETGDRCDFDATGTPAQDTDGDTLTGVCDTNGEGTNPGPYGMTPATLSAGQDVDGDGYMNFVDNCPNVANGEIADPNVQADSDQDTVGDSCDPAPTVPGDGSGYKTPPTPAAALGFWDNPNICNNRWMIGQEAKKGEPGDIFWKYCLRDETKATTEPYVNPVMAGARLSNYRDADKDATPDFWDGLTSAAPAAAGRTLYDYFDVSNRDGDAASDGCESFRGTDSLDASSVPGAPSLAGDCDGDGSSDATEVAAGTNPLAPAAPGGTFDSDGDGFCSDAEEAAPALGLNPSNWYDFYDVPVPAAKDPAANGVRNGSIDMGDVIAVLFYSGAQQGGPPNGNGADYDSDKNYDGIADGVDFDRTPGAPPGPPSTAIDMSDVIAALGQSGKACAAKGVLQ